MRIIARCAECGSTNFDYVDGTHFERCYCHECHKEARVREEFFLSPYERTRNAVYATGNRWAIENWNATHN